MYGLHIELEPDWMKSSPFSPSHPPPFARILGGTSMEQRLKKQKALFHAPGFYERSWDASCLARGEGFGKGGERECSVQGGPYHQRARREVAR